jgi:hypothetical protein
MEKPAARRNLITPLWCFRVAAPGLDRETMRLMAHGCRASRLRVDSSLLRIPSAQLGRVGATEY